MSRSITRRTFINTIGASAGLGLWAGCSSPASVPVKELPGKREIMLSLLEGGSLPAGYVPAAFFLHFDPAFHTGPAAVEKHLEYFRFTGMDFVKIQYERVFPALESIQKPDDWAQMPLYGADFYAEQLKVVEGLVQAAKNDALVLVTLYSPFMCAGHTTSEEIITRHILESPEKVKKGMEIITESVMTFVNGCIRLGVDGFYASTQGGEAHRFNDRAPFNECIKPYDLIVQNHINENCLFNILHVCDYQGGYTDLEPFREYPGDVVNCSLELGSAAITSRQASEFFGRPFMGGLERKGVIAHGSKEEILTEVDKVLSDAPAKFVLAADCTVPNETNWDNLRAAIGRAHGSGALT